VVAEPGEFTGYSLHESSFGEIRMTDDVLNPTQRRYADSAPLRSILIICVAGALLGVSYNWFGLHGPRGWGLPWIATDRVAEMAGLEMVAAPTDSAPVEEADPYATFSSDPLAVAGDPQPDPNLPEIPAAGRPVQIELGAVQLFVDAGGAFLIDARDPYEYEEGHLPGSINLPYETAISDPALLETLDTGGRPIIAYCGGGDCEVSYSLALELVAIGYERVAVYVGGFPEWQESGLPVVTGGGAD
jgi:rhodanese-related sulfurtransferase